VPISFAQGDLLEAPDLYHLDAIGHGVNCVGSMGAGIAAQIAHRWPAMYESYRELCDGDHNPLLPGQIQAWIAPDTQLCIYNIASQFRPGRDAKYNWLASGIGNMLYHAEVNDIKRIGLPRIGSGIGGLNQQVVENIIRILADESPVEITMFDYAPGRTR
jgi:O-acetyl-ADP-ribose deacetylase (regulator of RNase III)